MPTMATSSEYEDLITPDKGMMDDVMPSHFYTTVKMPSADPSAGVDGPQGPVSGHHSEPNIATSSSSDQPDGHQANTCDQYAVNCQSKVEAELHARMLEREGPSSVWRAIKWIVTFLVMLAVLFCLGANKITAIQLSQNLAQHRLNANESSTLSPDGKCSDADRDASSIFIMLLATLMIPQAFTLVVAVWRGSFRSDKPWPSKKALLTGVVTAVLEVFGLTLFALEIMSQAEPHVSVILLNGVFLIPILSQFIRFCANRTSTSAVKWLIVAFIFAFMLEITGIVLSTYFEGSKLRINKEYWQIPTALACLSCAWSPCLQEMQVEPRTMSEAEYMSLIRGRTRSINKMTGQEVPVEEITEAHAQEFAREEARKDPAKSARWKQAILTSFWKLLLTPLFGVLLVFWFNIYHVGKLGCGFGDININHPMFTSFMLNVFLTFGGYWLAVIGCAMCMQLATFALPLVLVSPLTVALTFTNETCTNFCHLDCKLLKQGGGDLSWVISALVCLYLAQLLSTGYFVIKSQTIVMHPEPKLFWLPGYCGVFLEQILLLGRRTEQTDKNTNEVIKKTERTRVYICTTMYRETEIEMEQLLRSLHTINLAQADSTTHFESHVFFDGAARESKLTEFVLQLIALVDRTLQVGTSQCTKVLTPYGMRLTWKLAPSDGKGMVFSIHLKDNFKVKNKKRWSQIMYMSYVIDWLMKQEEGVCEDETFILTTDADVKFSPDSVEALLDLMTRDSNVGAVCARTHPLGSGPLVWYQIFDYAIGHWFQKVANDVLGSVLCCPGCFSVYRIRALRDVVSTYATSVTRASEFLTKDMGEDRWLCTLMVQSGWRLEYCAVSEDSTHCPEEFDEFYKQRRRWIPSTLANQALLLQEWRIATHFNDHVGYLFLLYQAVLLFSTLIGPATCMLVITGGLQYAYGWDQVAVMITLIVVSVGYTLICLYTSQDFQLQAAKMLTFIFALVMAAVAIGTAAMVVEDLTPETPDNTTTTIAPYTTPEMLFFMDPSSTTTPKPTLAPGVNGTISTYYLGAVIAIFLIAGLMHITEMYCLVHGLWYWLCLPSGYLFLTIYSVCNITDRSWGTREEKTIKVLDDKSWQEKVMDFFREVFFCCMKKQEEQDSPDTFEEKRPRTGSCSSIAEDEDGEKLLSVESTVGDLGEGGMDAGLHATLYSSNTLVSQALRAGDTNIPIRRWLRYRFKKYAPLFEDKGYDTNGLIHGMTNGELKDIGVKKGSDRRALLDDIKLLPQTDIETAVPNDYINWLEDIGLPLYKNNFKRNHITDKKGFERLKAMNVEDISKDLGIRKPGHLKRLILAIAKLRYPTDREVRIRNAKWDIDNARLHDLSKLNPDEFLFWKSLTQTVLRPDSQAFGQEDGLKERLTELRNTTIMAFAVINALWILIIMTVSLKSSLKLMGGNAVGAFSLVIFGLAMVVQLLCMVFHRIQTLMHRLARAPFTKKGKINSSWSFRKNSRAATQDPDEETARKNRDAAFAAGIRRLTGRTGSTTTANAVPLHAPSSETFPITSNSRTKVYRSMDDRRLLTKDNDVAECV